MNKIYQPDSKTVKIEKQELPYRIERHDTENRNTIDTSTTKQILIQDKINSELTKKVMTEKKTTLPYFRNQDWKKDFR